MTPTPNCMSSCLIVVDLALRKESHGSRGCFVLDLFFAEPIQNLVGCFCGRLLLAMNFDGNVSYRKNGSGLDHKLQNIIIVQLTLKKVFFHLLLCYLCEKKRRILFQFFFFIICKVPKFGGSCRLVPREQCDE